ncbi:hypothetical protein [Streptomyces sp. NPDC002952]|uniref:hypothetical protein n=1 Tax=Streptomyces sp. NPDC002952 TaxID=3364673 RepID=UPI0036BDAED6
MRQRLRIALSAIGVAASFLSFSASPASAADGWYDPNGVRNLVTYSSWKDEFRNWDGNSFSTSTATASSPTKSFDEARVRKLLAGHLVLRNQADVDAMATTGATVPGQKTYDMLPHKFASMRGAGLTLLNLNQPMTPGMPTLLMYRPANGDVIEPDHGDFPYELAGWGYAGPYTPGAAPAFHSDQGLKCLQASDWFVHERSVHPSDTWQNLPFPPHEAYHGQVDGGPPPGTAECGCPVGMAHPRMWDTHIWLNETENTATVSMLNPGIPIPGFDPGVGKGFFYPEGPVTATAPSASTNSQPPAANHTAHHHIP